MKEAWDKKFQNKAIYKLSGGVIKMKDCYLNRELKSFISSQIKEAEARGARRILERLPIEKNKDELIKWRDKELNKLSKGEEFMT